MHGMGWTRRNRSGVRWSAMKTRSNVGNERTAAHKKTPLVGRPHRLCRRIGLPADSQRSTNMGSAGTNSIHRHRQGRRDKIPVISGISVSPRRHRLGLYYLLFYGNIGQDEVCVFLRELLRHLRGPVIALLDNSSTPEERPSNNFSAGIAACASSIFRLTLRN